MLIYLNNYEVQLSTIEKCCVFSFSQDMFLDMLIIKPAIVLGFSMLSN